MISVCIATYNGVRFIREQLESILSQLGPEDEVVVSDDGSTDGTLSVIAEMGSPLVKVFHNSGDHGYTSNFENALNHTHGEYIFLADQDDVWLPDKVPTCMEALEEVDFVVSDAVMIDAEGKKISDSFFVGRKSKHGWLNNMISFRYLGCCLAFRRCILQRALPFPPNHQYCTHDNWLTVVALTFYKVRVIGQPLIRYRRYGSNTSSGGFQDTTSIGFKIAYRLYLFSWLLRRAMS